MIAYFPERCPDELVYSWLCRYYIHAGCFSHKMALLELYCKRSDNPSKEFIGNLRTETREVIEKICPLNELVLDHTMYPQYARFISLEQKKAALHSLKYDSCDAHHLFCILPRMGEEQYMRFCPMCVKEDREKYGETYWHRSHQIRNMRICTKHKCRLLTSAAPAKSEQSFTFCPAEIYADSDNVVMEEDARTIQFAEYLKAVFDAPMDLEQDIPISAILYDGISRTKYLKPSGRSRYTKQLADDMADFYGSMGLCDIASMYQIQRVLLGDRSDFSVVCQTAFFLGMKPEELTKSTLTVEQIKQEQSSHYMKGVVPVDWKRLDMETAPVLEKAARSIYDGTASPNGRPERVSEKLIYREVDLLGHQLENLPRCKAIFEKYTESYPESWARKMVWAYRKLEEELGIFYWSDIRKISGVRKKNFHAIIPYLAKHSDAVTAGRIIAMIEKGESSASDIEHEQRI